MLRFFLIFFLAFIQTALATDNDVPQAGKKARTTAPQFGGISDKLPAGVQWHTLQWLNYPEFRLLAEVSRAHRALLQDESFVRAYLIATGIIAAQYKPTGTYRAILIAHGQWQQLGLSTREMANRMLGAVNCGDLRALSSLVPGCLQPLEGPSKFPVILPHLQAGGRNRQLFDCCLTTLPLQKPAAAVLRLSLVAHEQKASTPLICSPDEDLLLDFSQSEEQEPPKSKTERALDRLLRAANSGNRCAQTTMADYLLFNRFNGIQLPSADAWRNGYVADALQRVRSWGTKSGDFTVQDTYFRAGIEAKPMPGDLLPFALKCVQGGNPYLAASLLWVRSIGKVSFSDADFKKYMDGTAFNTERRKTATKYALKHPEYRRQIVQPMLLFRTQLQNFTLTGVHWSQHDLGMQVGVCWALNNCFGDGVIPLPAMLDPRSMQGKADIQEYIALSKQVANPLLAWAANNQEVLWFFVKAYVDYYYSDLRNQLKTEGFENGFPHFILLTADGVGEKVSQLIANLDLSRVRTKKIRLLLGAVYSTALQAGDPHLGGAHKALEIMNGAIALADEGDVTTQLLLTKLWRGPVPDWLKSSVDERDLKGAQELPAKYKQKLLRWAPKNPDLLKIVIEMMKTEPKWFSGATLVTMYEVAHTCIELLQPYLEMLYTLEPS